MTILSHFAFCGPAHPTAWGEPVISPQNPKATRPHPRGAFTLIELIAVMAIITIMLALLAPAVGNFQSTAGRNGAVNILMNTMEQARVAALESGRTVYVVFHRQVFPEQDAIMVLRAPDPTTSKPNYEQLTKWIKLPKGVLLHEIGKTDILAQNMPPTSSSTGSSDEVTLDPSLSPTPLIPKQSGEKFNVLAFNAYGGVSYPTVSPNSKLMLIVSEGVRGDGGTEAVLSTKKETAGGFEIITLRRYTGRASLEVSTL